MSGSFKLQQRVRQWGRFLSGESPHMRCHGSSPARCPSTPSGSPIVYRNLMCLGICALSTSIACGYVCALEYNYPIFSCFYPRRRGRPLLDPSGRSKFRQLNRPVGPLQRIGVDKQGWACMSSIRCHLQYGVVCIPISTSQKGRDGRSCC